MSDPVARLNAALEGRYAIERELGEGGMATVYLADDLKHQRKVALKVLKPELAAVVGAERFLAEITTTANLTHPHILPLFDSGEADGYLFYVMPHIEGESLRERIDREKQLPVDEAVKIATDLAEALDYAHRHKVIHRDIKPANILIHEGRPLIADFGIALAVGVAGGGRLTETGLSLGTPHYMSPEQATGDQMVGATTDIYALGCVLYEMLVGEPPYTGPTAQAVLGQIIAGETASATKKRASVPRNVDAALRCALEKLPADRFTSAQDFAKALGDEHFRYGELATAGAWAAAGPWSRLTVAMTAFATVASLVAGWSLLRTEPVRPDARFALTLPDGLEPLGSLAYSPDGTRIVFGASSPDGRRQLYSRELDQLLPTPIAGTEGLGTHAAFSPDGESIALVVGSSLRTVSLSGAPPLTLSNSASDDYGGVDWGPDGMIYFVKEDQGIWRVPASGGEEEEVSTISLPGVYRHGWPDVLPDGKGIIFTRVPIPGSGRAIDIAALSLETGEITTLLPGSTASYAVSGHLVYSAQGGTLFAAPFDADLLEVTGEPRAILDGLEVSPLGDSQFALSETGDLVYRRGASGSEEGVPVWLDRDASEEVLDPVLSGAIEAVAISPDGRRIAFDRELGDETHIWLYDLADRTSSRLTFDGTRNFRPFWSPGGSEIGFISNRDGALAVYSRPWDGSGTARLLRAPAGGQIFEAQWTPDERGLVYRELPEAGIGHFFYTVPHPDSASVPILETPFWNVSLSFSPDGRWMVYQSNESGRDEIYVRPFPGPGGRFRVSTEGGVSPVWAHNGREIFYISGDNSWVVAEVRTDPDFAVESRERLGSVRGFATSRLIQRFDVSPDDRRLLALRAVAGVSLTQDVVVQNFFEELRLRVPN